MCGGRVTQNGALEMEHVDRNALLMRPRQPYLEWMASLWSRRDALACFHQAASHPTVDLVDGIDDFDELLRRSWSQIFEHELEAWDRAPSGWPPERTLPMFLTWFEVTVATQVLDAAVGRSGSKSSARPGGASRDCCHVAD